MYQIDDVPADNEELTKRMHNVLSQPEIDAIILNAKNDHMKWLKDHKQRGEQFSFTLKTKAKNVSSYIRDILGED